MPFKSAKQKKTIDAAAHNPAFAKKVGIKVSDAKKMSAHGKGQTKFDEAKLDELSPKTLTSYKDKARSQVRASAGANPNNSHVATDPKIANRARGAVKADNRLNGFGPAKKVKEATDTVEKDEKGNVKSWKHEGDWKKTNNKEGRGKVTNLSDKARRQTAKMSKAETEMAEAFEQALEGSGSPTVTHGPNKGKKWSPETPGPTNPSYKGIDKGIPSPPDGATAPPPGYKPPKSMKKAEVTPSVSTDDSAMAEERSSKKVMKKLRAKHMMESIRVLGQLIAEAKKSAKKKNSKVEEDPNEGNAFGKAVADAKKDGIQKGEKVKVGGKEYPVKEAANDKCNHTPKGKKCPVHGLKECGSMYEGNDGNLANNAKPYDKVTKGDVVAGRLGKDEMGGKSKKKKVKEGWTHDTLAAQLFESGDEYMVALRNKLDKQLKG